MRVKDPAREFLCDSCPERFTRSAELEKHIETKHPSKDTLSDIVKALPVDDTVAYMKPKDGNYVCDLCGTGFMKVRHVIQFN